MAIEHEDVPDYDEDEREFHIAQDKDENRDTTPPEGEVIGRPALMLSECYVGGDIEHLTAGLRALGLDHHNTFEPDDYFAWATAVRRTSNSGGWTRAGRFVREGGTKKWMGERPVPMPADFARVSLRAHSPTPAIVVLVATFELSVDASQSLDDELRTRRYLRVETEGRVTRYASAAQRKHEAVLNERVRVRESARSWLVDHMPGTLTRDFDGLALPSIDFITTRQVRPFEDSPNPATGDHRFLLSIDTEHEAWESSSHKGWRLALPWRTADDDWTLVAGAVDDPAFEYSGQAAGDDHVHPHPRAVPKYHDYFDGVLIRWALLRLATAYEAQLAEVRDSIAATSRPRRLTRRRDRRASLNLATSVLTTTSFDASVFAHEVGQMAATDWRWQRDVGAWTPVEEWVRQRSEDGLAEVFGHNLERRCEWIADLEARLRDQLLATTNLEVASLNIMLQRRVFWLTVVAVAVAVATLIAT